MKSVQGTMLLVILLTGCVGMPESQEEWTFHVLNAVDTMQTIRIGNSDCAYEKNPFTKAVLGRHPEEAETIGFFLLVSYLHRVITVSLQDKDPEWRKMWSNIFIGGKGITVLSNQLIGIGPFDIDC